MRMKRLTVAIRAVLWPGSDWAFLNHYTDWEE